MNRFLQTAPARFISGLLLLLLVYSCNDDPYEIGIDLLPASDTLNVRHTDTCTVDAFTVLQDSVRSDKTGTLTMGSIMDPVFGKMTAGFYSQIRLSEESPDFGKHPVLDSLVLMLFYSSYYGDTLTRQNVKVYEISEDLYYDSISFSNQRVATYPTLLANQDFTPRFSDSVSVGGIKYPPHLRINMNHLTNYLGYKILNAPTNVLESNYEFLKFIKGLHVEASPVSSNGAILNFSIAGNISRMVVYFHDGDDPDNDSLQFQVYLNEMCARFVHVEHNGYLDASHDLKQQILNHDTARGAEKLFLQGMGGTKVKVKLPYFGNFAGSKIIAINDGVLELQNFDTDTTYAPPARLYLMRQDSIGRVGYLIDEAEGGNYFGGRYDASSRAYQFRITQHLQNILQNSYKSKFDLYLMVNTPVTNALSPGRIVLNGTRPLMPGSNPGRMKLRLTYTVLN